MKSTAATRGLVAALLSLLPGTVSASDVVLNEICAVGSIERDEEDADSDWVELHNRTDTAVSLAGWSLTDNLRKPQKWVFPEVSIPPGGYLVVFASGNDRRVAGAPLHTSFQLAREGEYLALLDRTARVASAITPRYPVQRHGLSYGLWGSDGNYRYLSPPTPGTDNGAAHEVYRVPLGEVRIRPERGFYSAPIEVSLSAPAVGTEVYFTLDGSVPLPRPENRYRGPFMVAEPRVVRARAFKPHHVPSPTATHTYLVGLTGSLTQLPVISLATDGTNLYGPTGIIGISDETRVAAQGVDLYPGGREYDLGRDGYFNPPNRGRDWERPVSVELLHADGRAGFQIDAGFRVAASSHTRGHTHRNSKFSYRLYFRTDYGPRRLDYPLIPGANARRFKRVVLRAGLDDYVNPFLRDELLRRLWADMGHPSARGTYVHLFLNGDYKGYYNPTEYLDENTLNAWSRGPARHWDVVKQRGEFLAGDRETWNAIVNQAPLGFPPPTDRFAAIAAGVDMESLSDYLLLNFYAATWDWPDNNWVAVRPRPTGKFSFLVWDAEGSFGFDSNVNTDSILSEMHYVRREGEDLTRLFLALLASADTQLLAGADASWRYALGVDAVTHGPEAWLQPGFDDSGWAEGLAPIGYGEGDERTVLESMADAHASVSIRHRFRVSDPHRLQQLILYVHYDDAFVAYLNGIEIARTDGLATPGLPGATVISTTEHEARGRHHPFDVSAHLGALLAGDNVLCVRGHNVSLDSSDFALYPVLVAYGFTPEHPFRSLFSDRVARHMFDAGGALTQENLRDRFEELKGVLEPVIEGFDVGSEARRSVGGDWLPNRRGPFLEQLKRHGLWFGGVPPAEDGSSAASTGRRP